MIKVKKWLFVLLIAFSALYMALQLLIHFTLDTGHPEGRFAIVEEKWVHYYCRGSGGPVVLFESDFGVDSRYSWQLVAREIAQNNKVCYYDRLGMGWSEHQPENFETADKVNILAALVDEVSAQQKVVLVANGYGGILSRQYASNNPNKIAALVFINSAHEEQHAKMSDYLSPVSPTGAFLRKVSSVIGLCKVGAWASTLGSDSTYAKRVKMQSASIEYAEARANFAAEGGLYNPVDAYQFQLDQIPIINLASAPKAIHSNYTDVARSVWHQLQLELTHLSALSELRLVDTDQDSLLNVSQTEAVNAIKDAIKLSQRTSESTAQ